MKLYRVEVVQTNVFYEEAESEEEARRIVTEDRFWDENTSGKDTYGVHVNIEEQERGVIMSEDQEKVYIIVDSECGSKYRMTLPMILEYLNEDRNPEWEDYDETDWREGLAEFSMMEELS